MVLAGLPDDAPRALESWPGQQLSLVVDADALNLLARNPRKCEHWVLTPHPGEAARLLGVSYKTLLTKIKDYQLEDKNSD